MEETVSEEGTDDEEKDTKEISRKGKRKLS